MLGRARSCFASRAAVALYLVALIWSPAFNQPEQGKMGGKGGRTKDKRRSKGGSSHESDSDGNAA